MKAETKETLTRMFKEAFSKVNAPCDWMKEPERKEIIEAAEDLGLEDLKHELELFA